MAVGERERLSALAPMLAETSFPPQRHPTSKLQWGY